VQEDNVVYVQEFIGVTGTGATFVEVDIQASLMTVFSH
jgi:hypothetical protein